MKYKYTSEIELTADIYAAKEYLDNMMRQFVDVFESSKIEEREDNV